MTIFNGSSGIKCIEHIYKCNYPNLNPPFFSQNIKI